MKEIILTKGMKALVDDKDFEEVNKHFWRVFIPKGRGTTYAIRSKRVGGKMKIVLMHRQILGEPGGITDHINNNGLDNRRGNLRVCTDSQNLMNSRWRRKPNKTSKYRGVSYYKPLNKWHAYIMVMYRNIHLGYFNTEEEAAKARADAELTLFGEFAPAVERI